MLHIKFYQSSSKLYQKAIDLASEFKDFSQDGKVNELKISNEEIAKKYFTLFSLTGIICAWTLTELYYDDNKITKEVIYKIKDVVVCSENYKKNSPNDTYCYVVDKQEGWHCKLINGLCRYIPTNYWNYEHSGILRWYDYGSFEKNIWVIDKKKIKEADDKMITIFCPHFNEKNIDNILKILPDKIDSENDEFFTAKNTPVNNGYSFEIIKTGIMPKEFAIQHSPGVNINEAHSSLKCNFLV